MRNDEQQLSHHFNTLKELSDAYLFFVRDGAIFVPTENVFHLGDFVNLTLTLPETEHVYSFSGEVIWITPKSIHGDNRSGIGVQCNEDEGEAFQKATIELLSDFKDDNPHPDAM